MKALPPVGWNELTNRYSTKPLNEKQAALHAALQAKETQNEKWNVRISPR
jgi:hypothetical protein